MASLYSKVKLYLEDNSKTISEFDNNIRLQNNTGTDYIKSWNVSGLAEPTAEQLASYEDTANTEETLNNVIDNRQAEYPSVQDCVHALLDGGDTLTDLQAKRTAVKDKYPNGLAKLQGVGSKGYIIQRRNAYPAIGDQLDMLWHSIDEDPALKQKYFKFYEAIKAVKAKYPK